MCVTDVWSRLSGHDPICSKQDEAMIILRMEYINPDLLVPNLACLASCDNACRQSTRGLFN